MCPSKDGVDSNSLLMEDVDGVCACTSVTVMGKYLCEEAGVPKDGIRGRQTEAAGNELDKSYVLPRR